ncbi:MAG: phosphatidylserine decarboxylase family protein [Phycisphaerales bacterium]|nr:phosphatidylserine decarboxylase family protein [Phycisphaerales bacterium]
MKIAPEGWVVIIPIVAGALILGGLSIILLSWWGIPVMLAALLVAGWSLWFFRDPNRVTPPGTDQIISPADGKVIKLDTAPLPANLCPAGGETPPQMQRVSIFLNIFNVHVNRVPAAGKITKVVYSPGTFFNASMDKASESNERSAVLLTDPRGRQIAFVQIAGWVARRIVNSLREGQTVSAGERFGLIRFGSRAEIYLPQDAEILVQVGEHVIAGESLLAKLAPPVASTQGTSASKPNSQVETVVRPSVAGTAETGAVR